jgi:hypothetical protein
MKREVKYLTFVIFVYPRRPENTTIRLVSLIDMEHCDTEQTAPATTHKACFPVAQICSPANFVLLMLCSGDIRSQSDNKFPFSVWLDF